MYISLVILPFVFVEVLRACVSYFALHSPSRGQGRGLDLNVSAIQLYTELFKLLLVSLTIYSRDKDWRFRALFGSKLKLKKLPFAIPAALYLLNNLIFLSALRITSPGLLSFCSMAKLPLTGLLHHFIIRKQKSARVWVSLGCITAGLVIFSVPASLYSRAHDGDGKDQAESFATWYAAPIAGFTIAIFSALATISNEVLVKLDDFWVSQFWLYAWSALFATMAYPVSRLLRSSAIPGAATATATAAAVATRGITAASETESHWTGSVFWVVAVLVITGGMLGLLTALLLRIGDSLVKVIAALVGLVTTCVAQYIVFPELRPTTLTPSTVLGGGTIIVSTWCYNHYKAAPVKRAEGRLISSLVVQPAERDGGEAGYALLPLAGRGPGRVGEELGLEEMDDGKAVPKADNSADEGSSGRGPPKWFEPTARKICVAAVIVICLTIVTIRYQSL